MYLRKLKADSWSDSSFSVDLYLNPDKKQADGEIYNIITGTSISLGEFIYYDSDDRPGYPSDMVAFIYKYLKNNDIDSRSLQFKP